MAAMRTFSAGSDQTSACRSESMLIAWPEMVRPHGEAISSIMSASCSGFTISLIEARSSHSLSTCANDSFVTSKIKARFVDAQRFNAIHVKVVTENSVAYLMGLVKRQEAKNAVEVARTTQGVKTVVTVLEYLD